VLFLEVRQNMPFYKEKRGLGYCDILFGPSEGPS